jgi:ubiquinone/menaquinone biosynthesis C-methylase UbiE
MLKHEETWSINSVGVILGLISVVLLFIFKKIIFPQLMPYILKFLMNLMHSNIADCKRKLFNDAIDNIETKRDSGSSLKILELGVGTGSNFEFYPKDAEIIILDKTDKYLFLLNESLVNMKRSDLKISKLVVNSVENMSSIESNSLDVVLWTFVLCSVKNHNLALAEIHRVLKPGGVAIFMEHSKDTLNIRNRLIQQCIEPLLGDCNFKDSRKMMENSVFGNRKLKVYELIVPFNSLSRLYSFVNPIVYGYGKKVVI